MWFIGVEVEQETSAPPLKKNPGSAPVLWSWVLELYVKQSLIVTYWQRSFKIEYKSHYTVSYFSEVLKINIDTPLSFIPVCRDQYPTTWCQMWSNDNTCSEKVVADNCKKSCDKC